jgi:hypothetical protein
VPGQGPAHGVPGTPGLPVVPQTNVTSRSMSHAVRPHPQSRTSTGCRRLGTRRQWTISGVDPIAWIGPRADNLGTGNCSERTLSCVDSLSSRLCSRSAVWVGPSPSAAQAGSSGWRTFAQHGISFRYPSGWHLTRFAVNTSLSNLITYVSNVSVSDPCVRAPSSTACDLPLAWLPHRAVLVTWTAQAFPGCCWTLRSAKGAALTVHGRRAKLLVIHGRGNACPAATEENIQLVPARSATNNWCQMLACLHGPRLAQLSGDVMTMVHSLRTTS